MDFADKGGNAHRRFFIGIGIGSYDDPTLDLPKAEPDVVQVAEWLRAMAEARRAGRGVVDEHLPVGIEVLNRAGRSEEAKELNSQIEAVDIRWKIESFSEQYEALRKSMLPGSDRTRRLTSLMLVPRRLAQTHQWMRDDVRAGWGANEDGKRLFTLGLMQTNPSLADAQILVDGIRESRSAFEQHNALLAAAQANLAGEEEKAVRAAVEAEVRGDPRPDGTKYGIPADSERMALAQRLLQGEGV
jgi:hypothetical protein